MYVVNVHRRLLRASPERVGALIDSLASPEDALWPRRAWPRMKLDQPLGAGATGGHGPIRYVVEEHAEGRRVRFRFTAPQGFDGWHGFDVLDVAPERCVLEHRLEMRAGGPALLSWPLVFRPLHDALIEDALSRAQVSLGLAPERARWSPYVRLLRRLAAPRRRAPHLAGRKSHAA